MEKKACNLRLFIQAAWFALTNGYVRGWTSGKIYKGVNKKLCVPGLNCYSCPGATGSCPIGSLQAVLDSGRFKASLYVFGFITAFGAFFGRLVCGWLCPFGLFQDLLYKIPLKKKSKNLPGHKYLKYLRYAVLVLLVLALPVLTVPEAGQGTPWFCKYVCPSGTLLAGIPLIILNPELRTSAGFLFFWKLLILCAVIVASVKTFRPFCKYLCPLGALYGLANPVASYRLLVDSEKCVGCGACRKACGMDIKVWETPNSTECIRCGACKAACPEKAITSTWGNFGKKITRNAEPAEETVFEKGKGFRSIAGWLIAGASFGAVSFSAADSLFPMLRIPDLTTGYYLSAMSVCLIAFLADILNVAAGVRLGRKPADLWNAKSALQLTVIGMILIVAAFAVSLFTGGDLSVIISVVAGLFSLLLAVLSVVPFCHRKKNSSAGENGV